MSVGRPASYCADGGCRRAAQSERQRLTRHLERLEMEAMGLRHLTRHHAERGNFTRIISESGCVLPSERLADVEVDITKLRARLRELLADAE